MLGDVSHPQLVRSLADEMSIDQIGDTRALVAIAGLRRTHHAFEAGEAHQTGHGVVSDNHSTTESQFSVDPWGAIDVARLGVHLGDHVRQPGMTDGPFRWWPDLGGVIPRARDLEYLCTDTYFVALARHHLEGLVAPFGGTTCRNSSLARLVAANSASRAWIRRRAAVDSACSTLVRPGTSQCQRPPEPSASVTPVVSWHQTSDHARRHEIGHPLDVSALPPDYDSDPERWRSWTAPQDVHEIVAPEIRGPVLDIGCGDGRLRSLLDESIDWVGVDSSPTQVRANPHRPVIRADMRHLPFADDSFAEVMHLWCLYHLGDPVEAIVEAKRVLQPGGRYFACTAARGADPELLPEGYPPSTFDADEAEAIVGSVFETIAPERWDGYFFPLTTREEVRAYCRHNSISVERAEDVRIPLWLTKRGVLVRGTKPR